LNFPSYAHVLLIIVAIIILVVALDEIAQDTIQLYAETPLETYVA